MKNNGLAQQISMLKSTISVIPCSKFIYFPAHEIDLYCYSTIMNFLGGNRRDLTMMN
jgi:hypothetical protein